MGERSGYDWITRVYSIATELFYCSYYIRKLITTKILLQVLTNLVSQAKLLSVLNEDLMAGIIGGVAQQAVERIDGIRAQAGTVFSALIHR